MSAITEHPGAGAAPAPPGSPGRREIGAVASLFFLALGLRFWNLGSQALWFDEVWTHDIATSSFGDLWHRIPGWESTPPTYYLLVWAGNRMFGDSATSLRSVGAVAGALSVVAVWIAGRELIGRRAGLVAAALCACSPFMWWYSQEARAYSLATLLCAVSLVFMARAVRRPGWGDLLGWAVLSAAAIGTQYLSVVVVATAGAVLLVAQPRTWRRIVAAGCVPLLGIFALAPLALTQRGTGHTSWIPVLPLRPRVEQVFAQFTVGNAVFNGGWHLTAMAVASLLLAVLLVIASRRASRAERKGIARSAFIAGGSAALVIAAALIGTDLLIARNLLMAWPAFAIAAGGSVAALGPRRAFAITAVACVSLVAMIARVQGDESLQRVDWRPAAKLIGPAPPGGRVIAFQVYEFSRPLSHYLAGVDYLPPEGARVRELDLVSLELPQPRTCWWGGVCADGIESDYDSRPVGYRRILGMRLVGTRVAGPFTVAVYRSTDPVDLTVDSTRAALPARLRGGVLLQR